MTAPEQTCEINGLVLTYQSTTNVCEPGIKDVKKKEIEGYVNDNTYNWDRWYSKIEQAITQLEATEQRQTVLKPQRKNNLWEKNK